MQLGSRIEQPPRRSSEAPILNVVSVYLGDGFRHFSWCHVVEARMFLDLFQLRDSPANAPSEEFRTRLLKFVCSPVARELLECFGGEPKRCRQPVNQRNQVSIGRVIEILFDSGLTDYNVQLAPLKPPSTHRTRRKPRKTCRAKWSLHPVRLIAI